MPRKAKSKKIPRLFYYDEGAEAFVPSPVDPGEMGKLVDLAEWEDEEEFDVLFKRLDMTAEEMDALPDPDD